MDVTGKHIFITGAASGIGKALADLFVAEGAKAVTCSDRNKDGAEAVAASYGDKAMGLAFDVTDGPAVQAAVDTAEERFGPIDLYVSNAGIALSDAPGWTVISQSDEQFDKVWQVNVHSHVLACRAVLPRMLERKSGGFLITASAAGLLTSVGDTSYAITKHAAVAFAESLAITHGDDGIYVGCLCPQGVESAMTQGLEGSLIAVDGMMAADELARRTLAEMRDGKFMIRPHESVDGYFKHKAADYDRWVGGMRKLRRAQIARTGKGF